MKLCRELKTVQDCIKSNLPSIGQSIDAYSNDFVEAYIKLFLIDLNASVNLKRPLNESQMDFIAMQLADKYRNLRLSDLNFIFVNAKSGAYGELYERLSPDKVLLWFSEYWEERMLIAAELSRDQHGQEKETGAREGNINRLIQTKMGNVAQKFKDLKK